jgi:glutathione S-transferase
MLGAGDPDMARVKDGLDKYATFAGVLDGHLKGRTYLVGNALTLADYTVAAVLTYRVPGNLPMEPYANVRSWIGRIEEDKSYRDAAPPKMG